MEKVAEILNIELIENIPTQLAVVPSSDVEKDLANARETYYEIINQGKDALEGALRVANLSEHPRAYEVVGSLLKNLADVNKQLIELASLNKATADKEKPVTVTNNVQFIGTNADLNKLIAEKLSTL